MTDGERFDWMEKELPDIWYGNAEWRVGQDFSCKEHQRGIGKTIREAIDDAIKKDVMSGCHDCPYCRAKHICDQMHVGVLYSKNVINDRVGVEYSNKTLPDNCPLEEEYRKERRHRKAITVCPECFGIVDMTKTGNMKIIRELDFSHGKINKYTGGLDFINDYYAKEAGLPADGSTEGSF